MAKNKVQFTEIKSKSHDFSAIKETIYREVKDVQKVVKLWDVVDRIQELNERESFGQRALGYRNSQQFTSDQLVARALGVAYGIAEGKYTSELSQQRALASLSGAVTINARKHGVNLFKALTGESSAKDLNFTDAYLEAAEMLYWRLNHIERAIDSEGNALLDEFAQVDLNDPTNKRNFIRILQKSGIWDEMTEWEQSLIEEGMREYYEG